MLTPELEQLIQFAVEDGEVTDKERSVLMRKAQEAGMDLDEFEMIMKSKRHQQLPQLPNHQTTNTGKFANVRLVVQW